MRAALADAVATVPGLRAKPYPDENINPPDVHIYWREGDPRLTFGTVRAEYHIGLRVFVRRTDLRSAETELDGYLDPEGSTSVLAALLDSDNWPDDVHYVEVTNVSEYLDMVTPEVTFRFADIDVNVVW